MDRALLRSAISRSSRAWRGASDWRPDTTCRQVQVGRNINVIRGHAIAMVIVKYDAIAMRNMAVIKAVTLPARIRRRCCVRQPGSHWAVSSSFLRNRRVRWAS